MITTLQGKHFNMTFRKSRTKNILICGIMVVVFNCVLVFLNFNLMSSNKDQQLIIQTHLKPFLEQQGGKASLLGIKGPKYLIGSYSVQDDDWFQLNGTWPVCLSTQASVDRLFWVHRQVKTWTGPISVAIYVPSTDFTIAVKMISKMRSCYLAIRKQVSFHLVYPMDFPPQQVIIKRIRSSSYNCDMLEIYNQDLMMEFNGTFHSRQKGIYHLYPQNFLRNVARETCSGEFIFTPDIDMLLSPGSSGELLRFLKRPEVRHCEKCAFIIPTYEISMNAGGFPSDKKELLKYVKMGWARRFHVKTYDPNQANSDLDRWERRKEDKVKSNNEPLMHEDGGSLKVKYEIFSWMDYWEPVYVAAASLLPPFDERFLGYGCTRSSQIYEMHKAGYRWMMLNEAFLCHRGFQSTRDEELMEQINQNNQKCQEFMSEVDHRYDGSKIEDQEVLLPKNIKEQIFQALKQGGFDSVAQDMESLADEPIILNIN